MAKISDELREKAHKLGGYIETLVTANELYTLADRIDKETVELPKDADGEPIHVGDTVWMADKGALELTVRSITLHACGEVNVDASCEGCHAHVGPSDLTHNRPDSLERIADDIETFGNEADINDTTVEFLCKIQERIYMLAAKDER